jgi:endonuclease/exonuclease/phosphatase (EEP) superfamily protein YafD
MTTARQDLNMAQRASRPVILLFTTALAALGLLTPLLTTSMAEADTTLAWLLDLAAHWQWLYLAMLIGSTLSLMRRSRYYAALLCLAALPWVSASEPLPKAADAPLPQDVLKLVTVNLGMARELDTEFHAWLIRQAPDLVVFVELSRALADTLTEAQLLPYKAFYPADSPFGLGILSKYPLSSVRVIRDADGIPSIAVEVAWPVATIQLVAFHPMPPMTAEFHAKRNARLRLLLSEGRGDAPMLIAGDFNATPWSSAFAILHDGGLRRTTALTPTWPALFRGLFGIPIDQVAASAHWRVIERSIGPVGGSDHLPVAVRLACDCPERPSAAARRQEWTP